MPETTTAAPTVETEPSTFTMKVITRHSEKCPYDSPNHRKCNCRKSLYIYEGGKVHYISAKTRSWTKAEEFMQAQKDARDPVRRKLREITEQEAAKAAEAAQREAEQIAKLVTVDTALDSWIKSRSSKKSRSLSFTLKAVAGRLREWAASQGIVNLVDIKPDQLSDWVSDSETWSELSSGTHNLYVSHLRGFFKWCLKVGHLEKDPSIAVERVKHEHVQTQPLTLKQFDELIAATHTLDTEKDETRREYGRDLRAIFLLMRWTGIRLVDALMLKRSTVMNGRLNITTQKTKTQLKNRPLPRVVIDALNAIPVQPHVREGYLFWSKSVKDHRSLTVLWNGRIKRLNQYLSFTDDDNNPMEFHSHMLRDTFAVQLLLNGMLLEEVSHLLTHKNVKMTEKYYAKWVTEREDRLNDDLQQAMSRMGAQF